MVSKAKSATSVSNTEKVKKMPQKTAVAPYRVIEDPIGGDKRIKSASVKKWLRATR